MTPQHFFLFNSYLVIKNLKHNMYELILILILIIILTLPDIV